MDKAGPSPRRARPGEIEARVRELEAENARLVSSMATVVSHEIRNPLAVIKNSLHFVKTKLEAGTLDPKVAKHLGFIESEVRRADAILAGILAYARMPEPERKPVAVRDLIESALESRSIPKSVRVETELAAGERKLSADPGLLREALGKLLDNAVDAMPAGGRVRIAAAPEGEGGIRIAVADAGPGVPPESLDKIFLPFFTTKPRGVGIGLAFARRVAERHGGTLSVRSEAGKGASFEILLPLER